MYPGKYAAQHPDRAAFIMAATGEAVSYRDFEARANRLAHLLRAQGLKRLGHYSIFMENNNRFLEACSAGYRAGLYFTCVNSYLTAEELAYILNNSESKLLITSRAKLAVAAEALKSCPGVVSCLVVDGGDGLGAPFDDYARAIAAHPATPIADESLGTSMLYSSGATGVAAANRKLISVDVSGDGDTASIGLSHFLHMVRRNVPIVYIIENNG